MAEEAFALSPISARPALPGEEDYAAISEAFMETSRGRWFLGEYAKRNRNADTRMVLDAVARIEQSLAAQKEDSLQRETSLAAQQELAAAIAANAGLEEARLAAAELAELKLAEARLAEARLTEALAVIQSAVGSAQASAIEALDALALEQKLAPVRKGARVIREIAWRLREIGNDGRICDLIDSQVAVIEAGAGEISAEEARAALRAAFTSIAARLAEFDHDAAVAPVAEAAVSETPVAEAGVSEAAVSEAVVDEAAVASASPAPHQAGPVAAAETIEATPVEVAPVEMAAEAPTSSAAPTAELAPADGEAALAEVEAVEAPDVGVTDAAADAHDEAMLDLIALEMGAPDEFEIDDTATMIAEEAHITELAPAEYEIAAEAPEPISAEPAEPVAEMPVQVAVEAVPEPAIEISLGSSLIASGMLRKPGVAANDPLAPIRRMSQAEKIAFFS
jgi:hypothetical protein